MHVKARELGQRADFKVAREHSHQHACAYQHLDHQSVLYEKIGSGPIEARTRLGPSRLYARTLCGFLRVAYFQLARE